MANSSLAATFPASEKLGGFVGVLLWVELCTQKRDIEEVLTPGIYECNLIWK